MPEKSIINIAARHIRYLRRMIDSKPDNGLTSNSDGRLKPTHDRQELLICALTASFGLMALAVMISYRRAAFHGMEYPWNTFLPAPVTRFGDFFNMASQWEVFGGLGGVGYGVSYFPAVYPFIEVLSWITTNPWTSLWFVLPIFPVAAATAIWMVVHPFNLSHSFGIFILLVTSYPALIGFHTGNIELWIGGLLLVAGGFASRQKWLSFAAVVGIAASFKLIPLVFLLVPLFRTGWKLFLKLCAMATFIILLLNVAALVVLPGGVLNRGWATLRTNTVAMFESQKMYSDLMVYSGSGVHYGHSFSNAINAFRNEILITPGVPWLAISFSLLGLGIFALWQNRLQDLVGPFIVSGALGCLLPPTSTDYKLLYLLPAFILLLGRDGADAGTKSRILVVVIALAMAPKPWAILHNNPFLGPPVVTAVCLFGLLVLSCRGGKEHVARSIFPAEEAEAPVS